MSSKLTLYAATTVAVASMLAPQRAWAPPPPGHTGGKGDPLERVVYVSGDESAADNGDALLDALDEIGSDGPCDSPAPSAADPCLVKLGPGVYDIGAESLFMVDHVDIEGSGEGITTITGSGFPGSPALLFGADAELRMLTVDNTRTGEQVLPVRAITTGLGDVRISHVTAIANGDNNATRNVAIGVLGGTSAPVLTHVTAITEPEVFTSARAIEVGDGSTPILDGVTAASASQALVLLGEQDEWVTVRNSHLIGASWSVFVFQVGDSVKRVDVHASQLEGTVTVQPASTVNLGATQLDGTVGAGGGTVNCVYVYDGSFQPHSC